VNKKLEKMATPTVTITENPLPGAATSNGVADDEPSKIEVRGQQAERRGSGSIKPLLLRGRMHDMTDWGCLAFICMPL
jgi:hypothetical protein